MHFKIPEEFSTLVLHDTGSADKNRIITLGHEDFLPVLKKDLLFGDGTFAGNITMIMLVILN